MTNPKPLALLFALLLGVTCAAAHSSLVVSLDTTDPPTLDPHRLFGDRAHSLVQ